MARNRMLNPEFWLDEELAKLSPHARLLYQGLWGICDDNYATLPNRPDWIKAQIFPYENVDTRKLLGELSGSGHLVLFQENNKEYWYLKNFFKHQKVEKPSKPKYAKYEANFVVVGEESVNTLAKVKISKDKIREENKDKSLGVPPEEGKTAKAYGDPEIDEILTGFETHIGKLPSDKKPRQVAQNMRQLINSFVKREGELFYELRGEPLTLSYVLPRLWEWYKGKDYATSTEKLETVKLKMVVWLDLIAKQLKQERGNYETTN